MSETSQDQLAVALLFVGRHLLEKATAEMAAKGSAFTEADPAFLLALKAFPSSSQTKIASVIGRDKTTLSRTVSRLEQLGLVHSRIDPIDGRRKTLDLTDKALSIATPAFRSVADRLTEVVSSLSPEEEILARRLIDLFMEELSVA